MKSAKQMPYDLLSTDGNPLLCERKWKPQYSESVCVKTRDSDVYNLLMYM